MNDKYEPSDDESDQDTVVDYDEFEDWNEEEFLDDNDEQELDFTTDESYRGDPPEQTTEEETPQNKPLSKSELKRFTAQGAYPHVEDDFDIVKPDDPMYLPKERNSQP